MLGSTPGSTMRYVFEPSVRAQVFRAVADTFIVCHGIIEASAGLQVLS